MYSPEIEGASGTRGEKGREYLSEKGHESRYAVPRTRGRPYKED